jgi:tRNA pseudouridine55 synthase
MFGVLNINKPHGWTSRDVVNRVHRFVRPEKAGHAGTLDPLATGVLLAPVGQATRLVRYAHRLPKSYRATFLLGRRSPSDDVDSPVEFLAHAPEPSREELASTLPRFLGVIEQHPPAYSAVSVGGQRAYKLARRGQTVALPTRQVVVHSLEVVYYRYPELVLYVRCGSGTYLRALGRDLAEALGTAAVMQALERTQVGSFDDTTAVHVDELEGRVEELLLSPRLLVEALPSLTLTSDEIRRLHDGLLVELTAPQVQPPVWPTDAAAPELAGLDDAGRVVSIVQAAEPGKFRPVCNFPWSE